ncbi:MAG: hypothetical protein LBG27_08165 [Spirochaetaceae bacterium]|nr:hypothetical protein [Spirochaetaceae bacterium]
MKKLRFGIGARGGAAGWRFKVFAAALVFALAFAGCDFIRQAFGLSDEEPEPPASGAAEETPVFVAAESGAVTEALTPVFNTAVDGLSAGDIEITPAGGISVTKEGLARDGEYPQVYRLGVSGITAEGSARVDVKRTGVPAAGIPETAKARYGAQLAEFTSLSANGTPDTTETTALTLSFGGPGIAGLLAGDVYLDANGAGAAKGDLGGGTNEYTLGVDGITREGEVTVGTTKDNCSAFPVLQKVTVYAP